MEQNLLDQLDKHTKPDPVHEFLKQYEQQHKNMNTYKEQSNNNYNENTTQKQVTGKDT